MKRMATKGISRITMLAPVALPATGVLLIGGPAGGLGLARRRKRAAGRV